MPIYFGLPVTTIEAFRLFNINYERIKYDIEQKHKKLSYYSTECHLFDYLVSHLKELGLQLKIVNTDIIGQIIVGYEIRESSVVSNKFINVDQFIIMLSNLKTQFALETKDYTNFREVELERKEGEPEIVRGPIPYIIEL